MSTKLKIIAGFVIMILLLTVVAVIGYRSLSQGAASLADYRRISSLSVYYANILADANAAQSYMRQFRVSHDPAVMEKAREFVRQIQATAGQAKAAAVRKEVLDALNEIQSGTNAQFSEMAALEKNILATMDYYNNVLQPAAQTMGKALTDLIERTISTGNADAIRLASLSLDALAAMRSAVSSAVYTSRPSYLGRTMEQMGALTKAVDELRASLRSEETRRIFAAVQRDHDNLLKTVNVVNNEITEQLKILERLVGVNNSMRVSISKTSEIANQDMNELGLRAAAASESASGSMLVIAICGLLFGTLLAGFIIFGLVRVLNGMRNFAGAIADGDFNAEVDSKEKGEIGDTIAAMRQIPAALQSILAEYKGLEKQIVDGELNAKGDCAAYRGGFATLVEGTNSILNRFLMVLENIPSPVLMMNRDLKAVYANDIGRQTVGGDYKGKTCNQLMAREDHGTNSDALRRAVETLRPASSETHARPQGKDMDVAYTVIPMLTQEGKLASVLQLITDLTAVKSTERTIRKVADQASAISNRLAAASEELSAQVEQVSRGAEQQRARVESTATAMTQMNATVLDVAKNAGQGAEQSEMAKNKAADGADLVNKVVYSINQVNQVASLLQTNMEDLGTQAKSIGGVMNVISDIADQTNLLALNAAIEAARAGDAGRGFAVVADEVRKLAEKTMEATQEVGSNISAIQKSAQTNIEEVDRAAKAVSEATELAASSGRALDEIVSLSAANSAVVTSIATAAEEQSATSEEINQSIDEISRIVAETSEGMTQSAAAVNELSQMAQELNRVMSELR